MFFSQSKHKINTLFLIEELIEKIIQTIRNDQYLTKILKYK
jgi:hypothetical protein